MLTSSFMSIISKPLRGSSILSAIEILQCSLDVSVPLVPSGIVTAWSYYLVYKTWLIQYTCMIYWRIPEKVVPLDVCTGFLCPQRSIDTKYAIDGFVAISKIVILCASKMSYVFFFILLYMVCALHCLFNIIICLSQLSGKLEIL